MSKVSDKYVQIHYPSFLHAARNLAQDVRNLAHDARTTVSVA